MDRNPVEVAVRAIAKGDFVVVVDSNDREDEGDLVLAGSAATPEKIAFMVRHTSGLICAPIAGERADALRLPPMVPDNTERHGTAFTVSVDVREGTTTGISASDRARTLRALADPSFHSHHFLRPGHIFPLRARSGGVLERPGHTEAVVDLARLACLEPAGVICELVNDDGSMQRLPDLIEFSRRHGIPLMMIEDLIEYRICREPALVARA
jgi:3,4-dihydroxy 2-butanone 4-phosphate synthase/GTP cyclohydrolase II